MSVAVEDKMLVHLVGDCDQIMFDNNIGNQLQLFVSEYLASRIMRRIQQHQLGARRDSCLQFSWIKYIVAVSVWR